MNSAHQSSVNSPITVKPLSHIVTRKPRNIPSPINNARHSVTNTLAPITTQCMRGLENDYPQARGVKKTQMSKYFVGGGALFLMIGMIWFPLLFFAFGSTVGTSNRPHEVSLSLRIGSYEPIYTIAAQESTIFEYSEQNFTNLKELYEVTHRDRSAVTFLENYVSSDVAAVQLSTESGKLWGISPPDKNRFVESFAMLFRERDMEYMGNSGCSIFLFAD